MPKAKPYQEGEEEEKTTIESQWEDEASTTVEQGEVADKVQRALGEQVRAKQNNTNITHTGAVDEPTVDDQHAPVLSAITPLRVDQNARLSITQGNDTGQSFEIRPGKSYTIGRAIDNDVVLTDIAVSRKHFELRHEDGAWVIVDNGSGNGTIVNGNVEDNAFMLANGDVIEIGNTVFRFEQDKGPARPPQQQQQRTMDLDDDEEPSTVAGKPMRPELNEIEPVPTPVAPPRMQPRPKTLPPPTPLRAIGASQPPPLGMPPLSPSSLAQPPQHMQQPLPASTLPLPQMANRPPPGMNAGSPTMLGDAMGLPQQMQQHVQQHGIQQNMQQPSMPMGSMVPTTIPGQGGPQRNPYPSYPQTADIPPHSVHAQMLLIQTQNRRGDGSTAHVPPMQYDPMLGTPIGPDPRYAPPPTSQLTQRTKYVLGGALLAVLAAVATIAIVKSTTKPKHPIAKTAPADTGKKTGTIVEPIKPDPPKQAFGEPTKEPLKQEPAKQEPAKQEPVKQEPAKQEPVVAKQEPVKQEPAKQEPVKQDPKKTEPVKQEPKKTEPIAKTEPKKTEPKKTEPKKTEPKIEARTEPKKRDKTTTTVAPKNVATANLDTVRAKAEGLYKVRKFNDASSVLMSASKSADDDEAKSLRLTADYYTKLGKALNAAEAPATEATSAYENIIAARNYDSNAGGQFKGEIEDKIKVLAPKAAVSYFVKKNYQKAHDVVRVGEQYGAADGVSVVRTKLDSVARDFYNDAASDNFSSAASKSKLDQILKITDSKSVWYGKAQKALGK